MTRVAGPAIIGSVSGKKASPKPCSAIESGEVVVEFLRDVPGQFQVLLLVLADRHMGRAIGQDVGRHQVGIRIETHGGVLAVLAGLVLELGHAVEPAEAGDAIEHPGELGMLGDLALVEHDVFVRVDAGRQEGRGDFADLPVQVMGVLRHGDRVHVDHAIDAVMGVLHRHEALDGPEIIAEMKVSGRLNA